MKEWYTAIVVSIGNTAVIVTCFAILMLTVCKILAWGGA